VFFRIRNSGFRVGFKDSIVGAFMNVLDVRFGCV